MQTIINRAFFNRQSSSTLRDCGCTSYTFAKDAVAWDERIENEPKKSVKLEVKWKLAHLLQEVSPQKIWVKIYSKQALVEA